MGTSNKKQTVSRRSFIKTSALLASFPLIPSFSLFGKDPKPSEKVGVAFIGTGERGRYLMNALMTVKEARILALCDVRKEDLNEANDVVRKKFKDVSLYRDFHEVLARSDIDAVVIATNDHWHGILSVLAAEAGKDMYVEKPLCISIQDDLKVRETIKKHNRIFQFGTQQRSNDDFRFACELVRNGYIGELKKIRVAVPGGIVGPTCGEEPIPSFEDFNYEMWLGPAPTVPFCKARTVRPNWFHIADYAMGFIGGWGIHHVDIAQWGHGNDETSGPIEYEGKGEFPKEGICDCAMAWDVQMKYADGVIVHFTNEQTEKKEPNLNPTGITFEGTEGTVYVNRETLQAKPEKLLDIKLKPTDVHLYQSKHHLKNFIECVQTRRQTIANIDVAVRSNALCLLSDIAIRTQKIIRWDPEKEIITDPLPLPDNVQQLIHRPKKQPWNII
ncbi:MAG TPA: Gfo/Idh/MocA family oxidoreductase [Candidatus Hydrogenedens sp.]|nr:Gfo/Idh/MocA family oxidoreductase [Candidatus Hydrogenedens sp.]